MNIKQLNEELLKVLNEDIDDVTYELQEELGDFKFRTSDANKLSEIYKYFDNLCESKQDFGIRNDSRGMKWLWYITDEEPDYVTFSLSSDHNMLWMSGSTYWLIPAKTYEEKVELLKKVKKDMEGILSSN